MCAQFVKVEKSDRDIALERIQAGFKGMAFRQGMNAGAATSPGPGGQHDEPADNDGEDNPCETDDHDVIDDDAPHDPSSSS